MFSRHKNSLEFRLRFAPIFFFLVGKQPSLHHGSLLYLSSCDSCLSNESRMEVSTEQGEERWVREEGGVRGWVRGAGEREAESCGGEWLWAECSLRTVLAGGCEIQQMYSEEITFQTFLISCSVSCTFRCVWVGGCDGDGVAVYSELKIKKLPLLTPEWLR